MGEPWLRPSPRVEHQGLLSACVCVRVAAWEAAAWGVLYVILQCAALHTAGTFERIPRVSKDPDHPYVFELFSFTSSPFWVKKASGKGLHPYPTILLLSCSPTPADFHGQMDNAGNCPLGPRTLRARRDLPSFGQLYMDVDGRAIPCGKALDDLTTGSGGVPDCGDL